MLYLALPNPGEDVGIFDQAGSIIHTIWVALGTECQRRPKIDPFSTVEN
jgi:hypothetical protein